MLSATSSIMIAAHKPYEFPVDDGYMPVHVGKQLSTVDLGILTDDVGENISVLNPYFCELTGLYWIWKNVKTDYYGLVHYRRYFRPIRGAASVFVGGQEVAASSALVEMLKNADIVLSKKRNYWIESIEQHYAHAHHLDDLGALRSVMGRLCPDYLSALDEVLKGRSVSLYNMFCMPAEHFNRYCSWLFSILLPLREEIRYQEYGPYQRRVFGFLAERLLNVWVLHNIQKSRVCYVPVINLEGESMLSKAKGLLTRKFTGKKLA